MKSARGSDEHAAGSIERGGETMSAPSGGRFSVEEFSAWNATRAREAASAHYEAKDASAASAVRYGCLLAIREALHNHWDLFVGILVTDDLVAAMADAAANVALARSGR